MTEAFDRVDAAQSHRTNGPDVTVAPLRRNQHDELEWLFADAVARGDGYPQTPPLTGSSRMRVWSGRG